ncbi:MAG: amidophosphoribosyltransferase [Deltaproteobacteria bacterium]|nr:amidophosphoribosyltransferase [Deltaproteobacteria bacterium]
MGGFFGVASTVECAAELFFGTDYHSHLGTRRGGMHSHLGTRRGGMVTVNGQGFARSIHNISNVPFRAKFEEDLPKFEGKTGIGVISDYEDQPLTIASHHGAYAIATVGRVSNLDDLAAEALRTGTSHFSEFKGAEYNQTELVATLINRAPTLVEGIRYAQEVVEGSCSILLLTRDGLIAARDRRGRTPMILGRKEGAWAVTLESCALPNLGYQVVRELGPAEVVRVTASGVEELVPPGNYTQICAFLWVYYGFPASSYQGINVEASRNRCGAALARRDDVEVDLVAGIPDSGTGHAIGYASEAGVPFRRPFLKYTPTWPRSFMPQEQSIRDLVAKMKLIPADQLVDGQRLLFCEDSIVRGTQLRGIIRRLFDRGAVEIHMRPSCPPLVFGCRYLNFSRSKSEMALAARKAIADLEGSSDAHLDEYTDPDSERYAAMVDHIRRQIGVTSLRYQRLDDMIEAIGVPADQVCTFCWSGEGAP